ncbi:MAG TPA: nucleotide sugar dehydrogenase [Nitrospirota bacterium]|nr:nucleotide sugar dehydrogenase [Nitrospirota bacterium]
MKVCVLGLWHLGSVTAACLAAGGHEVVGFDFDEEPVSHLLAGRPPLFEPGLEELIQEGMKERLLGFTLDIACALEGADVVWVAYDTPVDDQDRADVEFVVERVKRTFPFLRDGTLVLISSQLAVGTTRRLEGAFAQACPGRDVSFAYSPENLRLGKAIAVFSRPDRVVVGVRSHIDRERLRKLLSPFTSRIEWMSVESAEMTKHALNAFLAISITFANEIAALCEQVGADAKDVERGLKSEERIGPKAYVAPGSAFTGGTLARDVCFLNDLAAAHGLTTHLLSSVKKSNDIHRQWTRRMLESLLGPLAGLRIALWGLTYKPGTDTLRRSGSVELASWLISQGARVSVHDPAVKAIPAVLAGNITQCDSSLAAASGAAAVVLATEWPEYQAVSADELVSVMAEPLVIDPNRFLGKKLGNDDRIRYSSVGYLHQRGE